MIHWVACFAVLLAKPLSQVNQTLSLVCNADNKSSDVTFKALSCLVVISSPTAVIAQHCWLQIWWTLPRETFSYIQLWKYQASFKITPQKIIPSNYVLSWLWIVCSDKDLEGKISTELQHKRIDFSSANILITSQMNKRQVMAICNPK